MHEIRLRAFERDSLNSKPIFCPDLVDVNLSEAFAVRKAYGFQYGPTVFLEAAPPILSPVYTDSEAKPRLKQNGA